MIEYQTIFNFNKHSKNGRNTIVQPIIDKLHFPE